MLTRYALRFVSVLIAMIMVAAPAIARGADPISTTDADPEFRDRLERLEWSLDRMPAELADRIRTELKARGVPSEDLRGSGFDLDWDFAFTDIASVLGIRFDLSGNMILVTTDNDSTTIQKYNIALDAFPELLWETTLTEFDIGTGFEIDLEGDIYVTAVGFVPGSVPPNQEFQGRIAKIGSDGNLRWSRGLLGDGFGVEDFTEETKIITDIVLSSDGVPFFVTTDLNVNGIANTVYLFQLDPRNGIMTFGIDLEEAAGFEMNDGHAVLAMDRADRLYVLAQQADGSGSVLTRVDPGYGDVVWSQELSMDAEFERVAMLGENPFRNPDRPMAASSQGGVYLCGSNSGIFPQAMRVDEAGEIAWSRGIAVISGNYGRFNAVRERRDGSALVGGVVLPGTPGGSNRADGLLVLFDPDGEISEARSIPGTTGLLEPEGEQILSIEFDRLGNAYALMQIVPPSGATSRLVKLDQELDIVMQEDRVFPPGVSLIAPNEVVVDRGGSIFVRSVQGGVGIVLEKFTQPYLDQPTIQTASATLSFENQSIWAPGQGNLVADQALFDVEWDEDFSIDATFTVPLIGEFGGDFMFFTDGLLSTGVRAEVNGGTADVHFPIDMEFAIPAASKVSIGSMVTIQSDWEADPAARLTSCFTPTFNAGLTAGVDYAVFSSLRLVAFSQNLLNTEFINQAEMISPDYVPDVNLLDILANAGYPTPGEWLHFEDPNGIVTTDFRTPQLFAQGMYNPQTQSFNTSADDRFFRFGVSVTEAVLKAFGFTATAEFEAGTPGGEFMVRGAGEALQLGARADIGATQDIDVGIIPMITYEFVGNENIPTQMLPLGTPLNFTVPSTFDGVIEIVPTITATADFFNSTNIGMYPGITWKTIELGGAASAFGFDLINIGPECLFCYDWDVSEILEALGTPPGLTDFEFEVFGDGWQIPIQSVRLPCIRVLGSTDPPNLEAASRESLSMIIYDQTSPTRSSFNVATGGETKILLYGERFTTGSVAMIEHWGRIEALETTVYNQNTMLARIPDRFRLLPGVAKLFVETTTKSLVQNSDSIDLAIEFPVPRLDAVNPNLWAADPDLAVLPISVIDAKSFIGNDTYIARRDYYIKMRDELWSTITSGGYTGGAAAYFPDFDFNKIPEFPAVMWSCKGQTLPLPRFVQPVDNGIHNVRLAEDQYDEPMLVPVVICNPGPGGGMSNELMLTIAAPTPVTSSIEPANFSPLDVIMDENYFDPMDDPVARPIEIRVNGPRHVPQFVGWEEPKSGNFNASSVVRFNGIELETRFVSSSLLIAELPAPMATLGDHSITVYTPSNGTQYFEQLRIDANMDGVPDDEPAWQGLVESGGESPPLLFRVRYRDPVVNSVVPDLIDQDSIAFDDMALKQERPYNITLLGDDFREGAQVFFNGRLRSSMVVSETKMQVKLLPEDVAVLGDFAVVVQNPGPQFESSAPAIVRVRDLDLIVKKP
jgi:hypothetical protein